MSRRARCDAPGSWHHVMNRGIARRTVFETGQDFRRFGEQLGEATDRGELEVHAFSLMSTHYHLLVRSPRGELGKAMRRVQTEYSRWFNRGRKRDGPLVRSRYVSKLIDSEVYHRTVVSYIDRNAVDAKLVDRAADHWHGSAREYLGVGSQRTPWLKRDWVERTVVEITRARFDANGYDRVFGELPAGLARVVEARRSAATGPDPLGDILGRSPEYVRSWFVRKARLADGSRPGLPVLDLETLEQVLSAFATREEPEWKVGRQSGWDLLLAGLAKELCGATNPEIARRRRWGVATVARYTRQHRDLVISDETYGARAGRVTASALRIWTN